MAKKRKHIARAVIRIQKETPMNIAVKGNAEHVGTSTEGEHQMSTFDILPDLYANPTAILELIRQLQAAREIMPVLKGLVADIQGLMSESHGVTGLHLNGDVAPWGELEPGGRFERLGSLQTAIELIIKTED